MKNLLMVFLLSMTVILSACGSSVKTVAEDTSANARMLADGTWKYLNSPEVQATAESYVRSQVDQVVETSEGTWNYVNSPEAKATAQAFLHTTQSTALDIKSEYIDPVLAIIVEESVRPIIQDVVADALGASSQLTDDSIRKSANIAAERAARHAAQMTVREFVSRIRDIEPDRLTELATRAATKAAEEAAYEVAFTLFSANSSNLTLKRLAAQTAKIVVQEFSQEFIRQVVVEAIVSSMMDTAVTNR